MTFFSQARRTCGTTHFIRPCTILHATGFGPQALDFYHHVGIKKGREWLTLEGEVVAL
jgi:hypothetical protein